MRPPTACLQCRAGKRRCDRTGSSACNQCRQRQIQCSVVEVADTRPMTSPRRALLTSSIPSQDALYLVDLYFKYIQDKPHSLFHEPSFKMEVVAGTVSKPLLLSMMGLSARFARDVETQKRGSLYAAAAKKALKDDLENICLQNIQACILVGNICFGDSDPNAESLYFVLATRMAQILNLGSVNETDDGIDRETKLRVWWTCFIIDTWASGGSNLSRQFRSQKLRRRVPMDETVFYRMKPGDPDVSVSEWKPGLWGHMVNLVEIYTEIQDLNRLLTETAVWDDESIEVAVQDLVDKLVAFEESLELGMHYSDDHLKAYIARGLGRTFVAFHLGYHHYWTLLLYQYLDHRRPHTRNSKTYAERCVKHASIVCDILKASRELQGAEALYNIVGHLTVVSSSVLLHQFMFGQVEELPEARRRLESNLESLVQLRSYWSSVELMINRLVVFQNSCIKSVTRNTHRFDKWMVQFIQEHALALEEKVEDVSDQWPEATSVMAGNVPLERSRVTQSILMDLSEAEYLRW